ncbi:MAG: hypothetical protein ACOX9C_02895 [Kiritimatiellia bacterium]|jgi:drug/metabolite transporter (DMT)-like permease
MFKALLLLVSTGFSWVVVGAMVGHIGRKGLSLLHYQLCSGLLSLLVSIMIGLCSPDRLLPPAGIPASTWIWTILGMFCNGLFNYLMIRCMGRAMKNGPNAIVWVIIQSGFIFPFFMGWIVFGVPMNALRITGVILIVASIFLHAFRKRGESANPGQADRSVAIWLVPAVLGMICCGINQCGANLPSYLERGQEMPSVFRSLVTTLGGLAGCLHAFTRQRLERAEAARPTWRELRTTAAYAAIVVSVNYTVVVLLMFPGLDLLQSLGRGPMGFPIMVCSCVIGFFPYGLLILKERLNPVQALGVVVGVSGIVLAAI